jgi:hypothetical protein
MSHILGEDAHMNQRLRTHQFLTHRRLPSEALHVRIAADADEAFATAVRRIPEALPPGPTR